VRMDSNLWNFSVGAFFLTALLAHEILPDTGNCSRISSGFLCLSARASLPSTGFLRFFMPSLYDFHYPSLI
jgi:hypothetical protein